MSIDPAGKMTQVPLPRGFMSPEGSPDKEGYALYGRVKGGKLVKSRLLDSRGVQKEEVMKKVSSIWDRGRQFLTQWYGSSENTEISLGYLRMRNKRGMSVSQSDFYDRIRAKVKEVYPEAEHIAIDFADGSVRFMRNGKLVEIPKEEVPEEIGKILEFLKDWQELHDIFMQVMGIRRWHTVLGIDQNRSSIGDQPLLVANSTLKSFVSSRADQFKKQNLEALLAKVPEQRRHKAREKIEKTSVFIEKTKNSLTAQIEKKKKEKGFQESDIEHLQKIKENLESIDTFALFWAIAFTADLEGGEKDVKALSQRAQEIEEKMMEVFKDQRSLSPEKYKMNPFKDKPEEEDLRQYAAGVGSLLFHSDLDYLAHFDISREKRAKSPTIEEFVVHNMLQEGADYEDDLRSLSLGNINPEKQKELRDLIREVRGN